MANGQPQQLQNLEQNTKRMQTDMVNLKQDLETEKAREQQIRADMLESEKQLAEVNGSKKKGGQNQGDYLKNQKAKLAKQRDNRAQIITKLNEGIQ